MMILGYWITNAVGLILLHQGVRDLVSKEKSEYTKRALIKNIIISSIYTIVVVILVKIGLRNFPFEYFK